MNIFLTELNLWIALILITPIASFLNHHGTVRLFYGKAIASEEMLAITPRGLQDTLSDPNYNWLFFLIQITRALVIFGLFYIGTITQGLLALFIVFIVALILQKKVLPSPNSRFWAYGLLRTISNREANYKLKGDSMRSEEMKAAKEALIDYLERSKP
ncbi:hypothetical protein C5F52_28020 [Limnohabitans sp. TS-CS-82]|uniref:hypothetical protein n=1 Tax=Limnohabitans sp. TS-CS-82 TaxID=2094193 RepID=UPI000CF2CC5A|nr:hypothetical protein [Limnohabitans sp. TS-CS-82]PQA79886.1 hypothetical protein C5F52_28020 [Limnohabitans sp. TS-CS-82]